MVRNTLWIGSVKDSDNIWHAVITSPDEDYCHRYCERLTGDYVDPEITNDQFYTNVYTVEMIPIVVSDETLEEEEWTDFSTWPETTENEVFSEEVD